MTDRERTLNIAAKLWIFTPDMVTDLLIVTPGFPANAEDSTCIPPLQAYLAALLKSRPALRISVITTQYPYTTKSYVWNGITVFPCGGRERKWLKALTWRRAMRLADRLMASEPIKVVHSLWLGEAALIGQRIARTASARHVITLMGQDARDGEYWRGRIRSGSAIVAISEAQKRIYEKTFDEQVHAMIPWGIPTTDVTPIDRARKIDLLFCGSLIDVKRPLMFVDAVERIARSSAVHAVMIGDGVLRREVEEAIHAKGLSGSITLRGTVPHDAVLDIMSDARMLVHTSSYEGQGYVFDEALACGMSIVSGAVGSARAMDHWRIGENAEQLAEHALTFLGSTPSNDPLILHPIADTVSSYLRLYGLA